ncbi:MAG: hypothetical protein COU35_05015 [Candidatus Magasanikbacteria bacterium CG10_big_fil_rev_8_21_14_0_10_47_10]|uniref:Cell division protein FtsX n=1 Tax=Candidatus Magasanikbacteria bacterium CG10_big_fil_rev_8_21_14_0_10_47_10 TaxID=1974652 RepID=A0A2H0TPB5_9BACT|nr:MAG: hypothetical protein COU35_05015 [Candidatus Magasanikbacteria bacterium CG10_big_fil_rev_8_21_14_0_10_47_10]
MVSILRIIKFALQDIARNISLSFMTVLILVLMLLSVNTLLIVRAMTRQAVVTVKDQIDVSVYFNHQVNEEQVQEVRSYVDSFPEVTDVEYYDRDAVLEEFRVTHKDNPEIIASLDELGENPLGPTMVIKTREPQDYQKIITALSIPEYASIIEAKTFADTEKAIEKIDTITRQLEQAVLVLSAFFVVIAFFVIFNTIRVAIYTQRREIAIKKLVGATNWFVRGPYLIQALIFTTISVAVIGVVLYGGLAFLDKYIDVIFSTQSFLTNYFSSNILAIAGAEFGGVLLLTLSTTGLAMRSYLRT